MLPPTTIFRRLSTAHPTGPSCRPLLRTVHRSRIIRRQRDPPNPVSHGVENYFVDDDDAPPPNDPIYKVDATSDAAQSAYESPSGPWSRAGAETEEYQTVSKDEPYDVPGDPDVKPRYGGMKRYAGGKPETGNEAAEDPQAGPKGTERWGRKPEGRA